MDNEKVARKNWTTSEIKRLCDWAGRRPLREICEELGRSEASVRGKARELRKEGREISLRFYESNLVWCSNCATWRTKVFSKTGACLVCRLRERVDRAKAKCDGALSALPDEARAEFLSKQSKRGSCPPQKPKLVSPRDNSPYEVKKAQVANALAAEEWQVAYLRKMANAEKTRLLRIRRKAKDAEKGFADLGKLDSGETRGRGCKNKAR